MAIHTEFEINVNRRHPFTLNVIRLSATKQSLLMNEAEDIAARNAPAFSNLTFDPNAKRRHHFQAMGLFWSDELPHENSITELEGDYYRLVVFLLSYRAVLTRGDD